MKSVAIIGAGISGGVQLVTQINENNSIAMKILWGFLCGIVITITPRGADDEPVFEEFKVVIDGIIYSLDAENEFRINTSELETGMYTVTACAKEATTNDWYSYQFKIYIAR